MPSGTGPAQGQIQSTARPTANGLPKPPCYFLSVHTSLKTPTVFVYGVLTNRETDLGLKS